MSKPYTGGCACGAVRYEAKGEPIFQNHCQCNECRRLSGTGHGSYLTFGNRADVVITGEANTWQVAGDSGSVKSHAFCPQCGAPVYLIFAAAPNFVAVHAGSLDEPDRFQPQAVTYGVRGLAWDVLDPNIKVFDKMPT